MYLWYTYINPVNTSCKYLHFNRSFRGRLKDFHYYTYFFFILNDRTVIFKYVRTHLMFDVLRMHIHSPILWIKLKKKRTNGKIVIPFDFIFTVIIIIIIIGKTIKEIDMNLKFANFARG